MDLYQAGYFRLGKQGRGSGWDIIAPSDGMSNFAIDGFKGIAASLINLQETCFPCFTGALALRDGSGGALSCACAALDALIGIDLEFSVSHADSANRTLGLTCSTCYTRIADYVCHNNILLMIKK